MTKEELDAAEEMCDGATPGPWIYHVEDALICAGGDELAPLGPYIAVEGADASVADMELIAAARTALPELISEVRRLQADNEKFVRWLNQWVADKKKIICILTGDDYERSSNP